MHVWVNVYHFLFVAPPKRDFFKSNWVLKLSNEHPFAVPIFIILARFVPRASDRLPRFSKVPVCLQYLHQVNLVRDGNNFLGLRPKYTSITHVVAVYSVRMFLQFLMHDCLTDFRFSNCAQFPTFRTTYQLSARQLSCKHCLCRSLWLQMDSK